MRAVLHLWLYGKDGHGAEADPAEIPRLLGDPAAVFWLDVTGPDDAEARLLLETFRFHPLAVEDTRNQRQRPKAEEFPEQLFLILNPPAGHEGRCSFRELDVFLGRRYVVTIHPEAEPVVELARQRLGRGPGEVSAGHLVYVLLDLVVDQYFPILDGFQERIEGLEEALLERPAPERLRELFQMKRDLLDFRRVVAPQRDMFNLLTRRDLAFIDQAQLQFQLRDVYDHLLRIADMSDSFRDLLTGSIDLYMSAVSNRLNQVVNRLTVVTVLLGTIAAISGFYGMNFTHSWPPFDAPWGVPATLAMMGGVVSVTLFVLRRYRII